MSQSTVSRVFTGSTRISEVTRSRVLDAAQALDYLPDKRASRLRSGQTGVIAVVVVTRAEDGAREVNPFAYALLGSVCRAASRRGYETLVSFQASEDQFYARFVEQRDADALVVLGTSQNPAAWAHFGPLLDDDVAAVCWGLPVEGARSVRSDNRAGGQLAARHLWEMGYRHPAFFGPIGDSQRQFRERHEGFCDALAQLGGDAVALPEVSAEDRVAQGREAVAAALASGRRFDSIFAACDFIALGALEALKERGLRVPEDIGLVGYDGLDVTAHADPPLTTIKPDLELAGRMLVERVLAGRDETREEADLPEFAPVELVARASTQRR